MTALPAIQRHSISAFAGHLAAAKAKMAREDRDYAEYFYDLISEEGVDIGDGLSDTEFKKLIRKQYNKVKSVADEGFW